MAVGRKTILIVCSSLLLAVMCFLAYYIWANGLVSILYGRCNKFLDSAESKKIMSCGSEYQAIGRKFTLSRLVSVETDKKEVYLNVYSGGKKLSKIDAGNLDNAEKRIGITTLKKGYLHSSVENVLKQESSSAAEFVKYIKEKSLLKKEMILVTMPASDNNSQSTLRLTQIYFIMN